MKSWSHSYSAFKLKILYIIDVTPLGLLIAVSALAIYHTRTGVASLQDRSIPILALLYR